MTAIPPEMAFMAYPLLTTSWWLITGIDVLPSAPLNAVVAFGSTTDGFGATLNANRCWLDYLARRLLNAGRTRFVMVFFYIIYFCRLTLTLSNFYIAL